MKILLKLETNVNDADNKGLTPIYYAAKNKHFGIVKTLCGHGANASILDGKDFNILTGRPW